MYIFWRCFAKTFQLQGIRPLTPTRGSAPGHRWGSAPDPLYRLELHAPICPRPLSPPLFGVKLCHWLSCAMCSTPSIGRICQKHLGLQSVSTNRSRSWLRSSFTSLMDYVLPRLCTKFGERAFSHAGPSCYLPPGTHCPSYYIRTVADLVKFRKLLKYYYCRIAFSFRWTVDCFSLVSF